MATDNNVPESNLDMPPLVRLSAAFLLAAAMFGVAAIVAFGTYGGKTPYGWGFAVFAGICLGAWFLGRSQGEKLPADKYSRQRTMLGINTVSTVLLFLVLLVGANYIATRRHKTFDLTKNGANSLSDQSIKALGELKEPVKLRLFYVGRVDPNAENLIRSYERNSDNVKVELVNALKSAGDLPSAFNGQPMLVIQKDKVAAKDAKGVFPSLSPKDRQEVSVLDEQNVTSGLLKLLNPKANKVYFITGHGEQALAQMGAAKSSLESQNYTVEPLSLIGGKKIPADASAVFVMGPQVDLSAAELKVLQDYFNGKGKLGVFLALTRAQLPNINKLIESLGVKHGAGLAVMEDPRSTMVVGSKGDGSSNPILRGVTADVLLPGVVPLTAATPAPAGVTVTPIFSAPAEAMLVGPNGQPSSASGILYAATVEKATSRAVVSGNAAFADDRVVGQYGNLSYLLSAVNWTVGNDALVSIPPKEPSTSTLSLPLPTFRFVAFFSILVLPIFILGVGTFVWWRRR